MITTLTDTQRVNALNSIYQKGISTAKEHLAFSADKLIYLKPFISRLQDDNNGTRDLNSRIMARQIIDELLKDIYEEIEATCSRSDRNTNRIAMEYGLQMFVSNNENDHYYNKVA